MVEPLHEATEVLERLTQRDLRAPAAAGRSCAGRGLASVLPPAGAL